MRCRNIKSLRRTNHERCPCDSASFEREAVLSTPSRGGYSHDAAMVLSRQQTETKVEDADVGDIYVENVMAFVKYLSFVQDLLPTISASAGV